MNSESYAKAVRRCHVPDRLVIPSFDAAEVEDDDEYASIYRDNAIELPIEYERSSGNRDTTSNLHINETEDEGRDWEEDYFDSISVSSSLPLSPPKPLGLNGEIDEASLPDQNLFHLTEHTGIYVEDAEVPNILETKTSSAWTPSRASVSERPEQTMQIKNPRREVKAQQPIFAEEKPRIGPRTKIRPVLPAEIETARNKFAEKWLQVEDATSGLATHNKCNELKIENGTPAGTTRRRVMTITKVHSSSDSQVQNTLQHISIPLSEVKLAPARFPNQVVLYWRKKYITMIPERTWNDIAHQTHLNFMREFRENSKIGERMRTETKGTNTAAKQHLKEQQGPTNIHERPLTAYLEEIDAAFTVALSQSEDDASAISSYSKRVTENSPSYNMSTGAFPMRATLKAAQKNGRGNIVTPRTTHSNTKEYRISNTNKFDLEVELEHGETLDIEPPPLIEPPPPQNISSSSPGGEPHINNMVFQASYNNAEQQLSVSTADNPVEKATDGRNSIKLKSDLVSISELSVLPIGDAKAPEKSTSAEKKLLVEEKAAKEAPPIEVT